MCKIYVLTVCSPGTFKEGVGDEFCTPCPLHSAASFSGSVECQCDSNYYRSPKDPKSMPCTGNKIFSPL